MNSTRSLVFVTATALTLPGALHAAESRALTPGTLELFGGGSLVAGDPGSSLDLAAGAGYFVAQGSELGLGVGLHLDGVRQLSLFPFYRYHFVGFSPSLVPYVGAGPELVYTYVPEGRGPAGSTVPADHQGDMNLRAAAGVRIFPEAHWALGVELALEWLDVGEENGFAMVLAAGFSVYL